MPSKLPYRVIESRRLYRGHHITLFKDRFVLDVARDKIVTRELIAHPGAVVIVPFIAKDKILLLRQFRYSAKGDMLEIPAGTLEKGERPLTCAKRELEEETGFRGRKFTLLSKFYPAPGISNEMMWLYRADGLVPGKKDLDHDEFIEHETVTLKQAEKLVRTNRIEDGKTIAGILWALHFGR
jgi:ADP-ribose pyrophosphatase